VTGFEAGVASEAAVALGDRLLIRSNVKPAGLRNGDLVEIAAIRSNGEIALKDGRRVPAWFREFSHGYATTSHASQGKTVDRGILLMADEGIAAGNLKQAYVSNSRFRESQMIYTSDKEAARNAMTRPADRKLALEMTGLNRDADDRPRKSWRERWVARFRSSVRSTAA
jgi:ATP-dependent exoDNAse (exonuclease V) alpha subunit